MPRFLIALYLIVCGTIAFLMFIPINEEREFSQTFRHDVQQRVKLGSGQRISVAPLFNQVAQEFALQPEILRAIADHESGYNPWALNIEGQSIYPESKDEALAVLKKNKIKSYDVGLMQVNSYWLRKFNLSAAKALDPEENVRLGAWILRYCLDRYGYNWRAIGAYHTGSPDNLPERSKKYAVRVMEKYKKLLDKSQSNKK
ncbi:lytic transglycosylase domain-containing protein [Maridesulfovibrio ferrireducens]|uniref:lytic transglycosylase domain-containing protein n=1 Tax=Maridesulfovibrio ferrireducens TaxID=246191 RepID=UPI001A1C7F8D|nr:lytic transglycosylase domain-containing protein [Maridesulfovibrio ferrireducens]MBI9112866.1 lytic transglycosylase domain-containing protein [Maridesulfovibrio ferrireducens]